MDEQRWQEVKEILDAASVLEQEARSCYLEGACGDDRALFEEVSSLLAFHDETRDIVDHPLFDVNAADPALGRRIGHYRLVRLLGRGGMGKVYLASREDDYSKQVAIKLIQRGIDHRYLVERFHEERQILADLEHPAIARLLDGGTTDDGLPYLVMEHVEGEVVDRYCDVHRLDVRRRLLLFRQVLAAVAHSHRHLVVHRDLKPGNILVTQGGAPKLIDFGIAKLLRESPAGDAAAVRPRRRVMSPRYASPEQVRDEPITTASDVYALGVLLYELLCGRHPYGPTAGEADLEQAVCEVTPAAPSLALRETTDRPEDETPEEVARARHTSVRKLRRQLSGELDAIVMKAMRKTPEERYGSASEFAADVDRHLAGRPVGARPDTLLYRTRKLVHRHRLAVAAAGLAVVALTSILIALGLRLRVEHERAQTAAIGDFVENLFRAADPDRADGEDLTVRQLLDRGRDKLGSGLESQPLVRSALLTVVGRVYDDLGELDQAESLLTEALELQRRYDPGDDATMADRQNALGVVLRKLGRPDEAEVLYQDALERLGGCGAEPPEAFWLAGNLAWLRTERGEFAEAEALVECLEDRQRRGLTSSDDPAVSSVLSKLGSLRYKQQDFEESAKLFREALALREEYHGPNHTNVARSLNNLGKVLLALGESAEAESRLRRALAIRRELLSPDHDDTLNTEKNLAQALFARGDAAAAEELARRAVEGLRSRWPEDDWRVADAEGVLGVSLAALGRCDEAGSLVTSSFSVVEREKGESSLEADDARRRIDLLQERCGSSD